MTCITVGHNVSSHVCLTAMSFTGANLDDYFRQTSWTLEVPYGYSVSSYMVV